MKKFLVLLVVLFSIASFAQNKQTILISNKYEFQSEKNSHNINNMLKAILTSNDYQVYFDDEVLPVEIAQNRCNALTGILINVKSVFLTKVKFQIKDCQNNLLFETAEVKSKEKDAQMAYMECIKLLSPELKKYKPSFVEKKEVFENNISVESLKVSEFKTFLNCSFEKSFDDSRDFEIGGSEQNVLLFLQKTKNTNIFIAYKEGANGVFTKTGNKGVFEYYVEGKYMVEEYLFQ